MDVLSVKEVAEYLKCSESSIRKLVRNESIPYFRIGYKLNFIKNAIDSWVDRQQNNDEKFN